MALALAVAIATSVAVLAIYQPQIEHDVDGRSGARLALRGMLDQQSGVRAYLLAGDARALDDYHAGQRELADGDAAVDTNLGNNSSLAPLLDTVRRCQQAWTEGWAQPLASAPPPSAGVSRAVIAPGTRLFATYRTAANRLSAAITAQLDAARRDSGLAIGVGSAVQAVLFALLLVVLVRESRRLRRALVSPFAALLHTMRAVRDGDLSARAVEQGPTELRQVAAGLNEMTHALAEERSMRASRETEAMYNAARLGEMLVMARNLAGSLNLRYVLDAASTHAVSVSGHEQATIWLSEEAPERLTAALTATAGGTGRPQREDVEMGQGCVGQAARFGRIVTGTGGTPTDQPDAHAVIAVPMIVGARVVGVIELTSSHPYEVPASALSLVETLASHAGTAIEAARLHARTEELTQVDALTRLFNRRRLESDLDRECKRSRRYDRPLTFCMLDVDHFKRFNDRHGHRRGDEVLEEVGRLLHDGVRSSDSAYRYGGEEFGLLLRETTLGSAVALCERLRGRIATRFAGSQQITASFGVAALGEGMQSPADFLDAADRALYQAKSAGRNRVIAATGAVANGDATASQPHQPG
jgi:diguanylate cyclase (GGDEF)-like protein